MHLCNHIPKGRDFLGIMNKGLYDIFISYRRDGGFELAKHLYDLLSRDGYTVSFDIDTLRNGDFDKALINNIDNCQDFILIVDPKAFDRVFDTTFPIENDWMRQELAHALKHNKNVVPIFLEGVTGFPTGLPEDISAITKKNASIYNKNYFDDFYRKLKEIFLTTKSNQSQLVESNDDYEDAKLKGGIIFHQLRISCPICMGKGKITPKAVWTHGECGGKLYLGQDGTILCEKCKIQSSLKEWTFACPSHSNVTNFIATNKYRPCTAADLASVVAINASLITNIGIDNFNNILQGLSDGSQKQGKETEEHTITLKISNTGETIPVYDIDLDIVTGKELLSQLCESGLVSVEKGKIYRIIGVNNQPIFDDTKSLAEIGITYGSTVVVVAKPVGGCVPPTHLQSTIEIRTTWDGVGYEVEDVDLNQVTNKDLIQQMVDAGVMKPESQCSTVAEDTYAVYSLIDKDGLKVEPDEIKTLSQLGFVNGDTIRIIQRGSGGAIQEQSIRETCPKITYAPNNSDKNSITEIRYAKAKRASTWDWLKFGCRRNFKRDVVRNFVQKVTSSIYAPAEVSRGDFMMIQVFLYKDDEQEKVESKAKEVDPDAMRKNFTPLYVPVKKGDKVTAHLQMSGKGLELDETDIEMIWQDHYTDCQFSVYVPEDYKPQSVVGIVTLSVNGAPAGRMTFKSKIVDAPRSLYAEIVSHKFNKIFISYSHLDEDKVKFIHQAYEALNVDHFFDRAYLKPGDVYPEKIKNYIESTDLFILCWSENAKNSDYVQLEIEDAMKRAYPGIDMDKATLAIHPLDIDPHADLPEEMNKVYIFGRM